MSPRSGGTWFVLTNAGNPERVACDTLLTIAGKSVVHHTTKHEASQPTRTQRIIIGDTTHVKNARSLAPRCAIARNDNCRTHRVTGLDQRTDAAIGNKVRLRLGGPFLIEISSDALRSKASGVPQDSGGRDPETGSWLRP
jgi:hypothetical protein